ncbi:hypothetical protein TSMEX_001654 [Taenia solium]|eukprot:TsM_001110100 transcript=TsM_001110100 gene=TsM_001110100
MKTLLATVLLHDPLYSWSLSPAQLCALEARRAEVAGRSAFPGGGGGGSSIFANSNTTVAAAAAGSIINPYGTASRRPRDSINQLAERVLLTVRDKLAGRVGGIGSSGLTAGTAAEGALGTLGPAGHVALLVRAATDPQNLGCILLVPLVNDYFLSPTLHPPLQSSFLQIFFYKL